MTNIAMTSSESYEDALGVKMCDHMLIMPFRPALIGRTGFLHGGAIAGLLSLACDRIVGDDAWCFTSTFQFLRGARQGDLHAVATIARGASIATVNAMAWQDDERRPVASACRKYRLT